MKQLYLLLLLGVLAIAANAQNTTNLEIGKPQPSDSQWLRVYNGFDAFDAAVAGRLSKSVAGGTDVTLTTIEARNRILEFTGTLTGNINVIVPSKNRAYIVYNNTAGAFSLTVKTSGGTGVSVGQGTRQHIYCDSTNVVSIGSAASGDVVGPGSATDNNIPRFDGTTGKLLQGSGVTISDTDAMTIPSSSSSALAVGPSGKAFKVDGSRAFLDDGVQVDGGQAGEGGLVKAISGSLSNAPLKFEAKGNGNVEVHNGIFYMKNLTFGAEARSPSQITSNQNDYNPGGRSWLQRWSTDASRDVTGLTHTISPSDGQSHLITNVGSFNIVFKHQDTGSSASNRFITFNASDLTLQPSESVLAVFDNTSSRWRLYRFGAAVAGTTSDGSVQNPPDVPPSSPNAADDEFKTGSSFDTAGNRFSGASAWTLYESGGGNVGQSVDQGAGNLWLTAVGANSIQGYYQTLPAGDVKYRAKINLTGDNATSNYGGLFLHDATGGKLEAMYLRPHVTSGNIPALEKGRWTNQTTFDATSLVRTGILSQGFTIYLEIERSGTTLNYRYSTDGRRYVLLTSNSETAHMANSPNRIGVFFNTSSTNGPYMSVEWFRRVN